MRRRLTGLLLALLALTVLGLTAAPQATAHHGDTGQYDRSRAIWVSGEIRDATVGNPHTQLELTADGDGPIGPMPSGVTELDRVFGPGTTQGLTVRPAGTVTLLFSPLSAWTEQQLSPGTRIEAIAIPRCPQDNQYDGEYRVAWSRVGDTIEVNRDPGIVEYTLGCPDVGLAAAPPPSPTSDSDAATGEAWTLPRSDQPPFPELGARSSSEARGIPVPLLVAGAALLALGITVVVILTSRRRGA